VGGGVPAPHADPGAATAAWAAERGAPEAAAALQAAGVPAAPVRPVHRLGDDPHLAATGFWEVMERAYVGAHTLGAPPFRIDGRRPVARRAAPPSASTTPRFSPSGAPTGDEAGC